MQNTQKPLLRGHFHQAAFFIAVGACFMLVEKNRTPLEFICLSVYSLSLCALFGISALYHRPNWSPQKRMWMKRLDHAAIYVHIASTGTPICILGLKGEVGTRLLSILWIAVGLGVLQSLFWVKAPKWISVLLYVSAGMLAMPYLPELSAALGQSGVAGLLIGGAFYGVGAAMYALKRPNPMPNVLGYHELFHILVVIGAFFHFSVVNSLTRM